MPTTVPAGFLADAMIKVAFVPAIADTTGPLVATEVKAVGSVDATCYLTAQLSPGADQATITDDRMCLKQVLERPGAVTYTLDELNYVYDVQNPTSESNKLYAALPAGTTGFLVVRYGIDVDTDWAADQIADVIPVEAGAQIKMPGERNTVAKVRQKLFVTGPKQDDVTLVA